MLTHTPYIHFLTHFFIIKKKSRYKKSKKKIILKIYFKSKRKKNVFSANSFIIRFNCYVVLEHKKNCFFFSFLIFFFCSSPIFPHSNIFTLSFSLSIELRDTFFAYAPFNLCEPNEKEKKNEQKKKLNI